MRDLLGAEGVAKQLLGPISRGIGRISAPFLNRLANRKQLANFDEWDQALRERGYDPKTVELTLGQHTEVRVTADNIRHQANRENVAIEAIYYIQNTSARIDPHFENEPLQPEWVDQFWRLAENISSADMQAFWGKVLSRKCLGLSNISARALHFISTLSGEEAHALEQIAARLVTVVEPSGATISGLVGSLHHWTSKSDCPPRLIEIQKEIHALAASPHEGLFSVLGVFHQGGFVPSIHADATLDPLEFSAADQRLRVTAKGFAAEFGRLYIGSGPYLSPLGVELAQVIGATANQTYVDLLIEGFQVQGVTVERA
ncbi:MULTISPECIES: DUF2806 domain-containing protein [unclassified Rhizobium]|uniref:DUF2806 domain-containing protein n=1 Tax=unclassified Rhizobium TaxID=2613769 RepID=UPI0013C52DAD|nr:MULTISPECIES: DUF2806 domain-containing protein [unclassified Rhizobium]